MRTMLRWTLIGFVSLMSCLQASAGPISLFEYAFNIDGTVTNGSAPSSVNLAGFDTGTGLGTISVTLGGVGAHQVGAFLDHEIDETTNTFFNEVGSTTGAPTAGQSWEIDEPGYVFGDIYANFVAGALDNGNGVPAVSPDDVSMAMAWNFVLQVDQSALLRFVVSTTAPASGFYLTQYDPDSDVSLYLSSALDIRTGGTQIPEPASWVLVALALLAAGLMRRKPVPVA